MWSVQNLKSEKNIDVLSPRLYIRASLDATFFLARGSCFRFKRFPKLCIDLKQIKTSFTVNIQNACSDSIDGNACFPIRVTLAFRFLLTTKQETRNVDGRYFNRMVNGILSCISRNTRYIFLDKNEMHVIIKVCSQVVNGPTNATL